MGTVGKQDRDRGSRTQTPQTDLVNYVAEAAGKASDQVSQKQVYVVDDDLEMRHSLEFLLATQDITVHSFACGSEFLQIIDSLAAAPIILDIRMPRMNGIEVLEELAKRAIAWPVIVLSGHGEIEIAVQAIKLGAIDFLEKPVEAAHLEKCLERAFASLTDQDETTQFGAASLRALALLTARESEVLAGLCSGQANKQVAFALSISPRTVEMHRANALRRLKVRTIAEVVTMMNAAKLSTDTRWQDVKK